MWADGYPGCAFDRADVARQVERVGRKAANTNKGKKGRGKRWTGERKDEE